MALDWSQCPEATRSPDILGGVWVLKGTRIPVATLLEHFAGGTGPVEMLELFEGLTAQQVEGLCAFLSRSLELTRKERETEAMPVVTTGEIDWSQCPGITRTPDTVSGAWRFEDSRLMLECVFDNLAYASLSQIAEEIYPTLDVQRAAGVLEFAAQTLHEPALAR